VVAADRAEALAGLLRAQGETVYTLGHIVPGEGVIYQGKLL
jgi:phosphoribosylformylglycinamidine cyclo-ligase